jgi:hypothetical protein
LGFFSPSYRSCEARFSVFVEMRCLFSIAPDVRTGGEVTGETLIGRWLRQRRTLTSASGVFTAEARANKVVIGASDAMASDAGQTLCSVWWLCDVSSLFEPSCASNAVASVDPPSDAFGERKSSLVAYWSASDAECWASDASGAR